MNYPDMPYWVKQNLNVTYAVYGDLGTYINSNPTSLSLSEYQGYQFHWHAPSEHTLNGNHYDLEMHIVHFSNYQPITEYQNIAVVAVVFKVGSTESTLLNSVFNNGEVRLNELFSGVSASNFAMYTGSLTTPPCSEQVSWYLYEFPQSISQTQLDFFQDLWAKNPAFANGNGNNRMLQELNGRKVYAYVPPSTPQVNFDKLEYF